MNRAAVLQRLRRLVAQSGGSQTAAAAKLQVTRQELCDVLKGRRPPTPALLHALRLRRVMLEIYRRVPAGARSRCA